MWGSRRGGVVPASSVGVERPHDTSSMGRVFRRGMSFSVKRQTREWQKILASHVPSKGLVPRIYKELAAQYQRRK